MSAGDLDLLSGICDFDGSDNESEHGATMFRSQSTEELVRASSAHEDINVVEGDTGPEIAVEGQMAPLDEAMSTSESDCDDSSKMSCGVDDYSRYSDDDHEEDAEGRDRVADVISATGMSSRHSQVR